MLVKKVTNANRVIWYSTGQRQMIAVRIATHIQTRLALLLWQVMFTCQYRAPPLVPSYFFKNTENKSIGSGMNVVVLCSLAISRMVWR